MKYQIILFSISFLLSNSLWAESNSNCSNIDRSAYPDEYKTCLRLKLTEKANEAGYDCVDCFANSEENKGPSSWVLALSAVAQPLAYFGGAYITSKYQYKSQKAWADAYKSGYQQCTNRFNSYLDYTTSNGANVITSDEAKSLMNCNGNNYNAYSGYAGLVGNDFSGFGNPWMSSGYSSGFMTGMIGPNFGTGISGDYGYGLGTSMYGGMNSGLYGGAGIGLYGNVGMMASPYMMNYSSGYNMYGGAGMNAAGMGVNSLYGNYGGMGTFGGTPYAAGNLSTSIGLSGTGYAF